MASSQRACASGEIESTGKADLYLMHQHAQSSSIARRALRAVLKRRWCARGGFLPRMGKEPLDLQLANAGLARYAMYPAPSQRNAEALLLPRRPCSGGAASRPRTATCSPKPCRTFLTRPNILSCFELVGRRDLVALSRL